MRTSGPQAQSASHTSGCGRSPRGALSRGPARRGQEQTTGKSPSRCFHEAGLPAHLSRDDAHLRPFLLQEGFDALDPFVPILVPGYSPKEFESCIQYYLENDWLQHAKGR